MQQPCPHTTVCPEKQPEAEDSLTSLVKRVLLFADGSTTRLLQCFVGQSITVQVHHQTVIERAGVPSTIVAFFPHEEMFLYRISSLYASQTLLSTNVVYTATSALPTTLQTHLFAGTVPLGRLIGKMETRRDLLRATERCFCDIQPLFQDFALLPRLYPVKEYNIIHLEKCWFYVCELFHLEQILSEARLSKHFSQIFLEGVAGK